MHGVRIYHQRIAPGDFHLRAFHHPPDIGLLANCRDDRITFDDELGTLNRHWPTPSAFIRGAQFSLDTLKTGYPTRLALDTHGCGEIMNIDSLGQSALDLFWVSRHLLAAAAIDDVYLLATEPKCGSSSIDGHIASADDYHLVARPFSLA